jgi:hypothetical protein
MERYEGYRTRAVPLRLNVRQNFLQSPTGSAFQRLMALRELMRMELPDRKSDIVDLNNGAVRQPSALVGIPTASLVKSYYRAAARATGGNLARWTPEHESAECLYLIISTMHDGDKNAIDFFMSEEIGDTDGDGMKEILDAWGTPLTFLRWAPGYVTNPWDPARGSMLTTQTHPALDANGNVIPYTPDPFDPVKAGPNSKNADVTLRPFELRPLILSAGNDKELGIIVTDLDNNNNPVSAFYPSPPDPYMMVQGGQRRLGEPLLGTNAYADNITNHYQETPQ